MFDGKPTKVNTTESEKTITYTVIKGDTLFTIVNKLKVRGYRTTVDDILAANPRIEDRDLIMPGWDLKIPTK